MITDPIEPPPPDLSYSERTYVARLEAEYDRRYALMTADIRKLTKENEDLNGKLRELGTAGRYYLRMQKHIIANENIMDAWKEFIAFYSLCVPDIDELDDFKE